jgi:putative alpha-1,2-mannosidase
MVFPFPFSVPRYVGDTAEKLDRYFAEASARGISRDRAQNILDEEKQRSVVSLTITMEAAFNSALHRLRSETTE